MGRAARRQQDRQSKRQPLPTRARGLTTSPSVALPAGAQAVAGPWWKPRWAMDIISELRKVTWPTRQETVHLTVVVVVISLLFGIVLGTADFAFSWLVEETILR